MQEPREGVRSNPKKEYAGTQRRSTQEPHEVYLGTRDLARRSTHEPHIRIQRNSSRPNQMLDNLIFSTNLMRQTKILILLQISVKIIIIRFI